MSGSWIGIKVKHPELGEGKIVTDWNPGMFRQLSVELRNGKTETIGLCNTGPNPSSTKPWKWFSKRPGEKKGIWIGFGN